MAERSHDIEDRLSASGELGVELSEAEAAIDRLKEAHGGTSDAAPLIAECERWLACAKTTMSETRPWNRFFSYDQAYACLHRIRHRLCMLLPVDQLFPIVAAIRFDLTYVPDDIERKRRTDRLEALAAELVPSEREGLSEADLRHALANESIAVAHFREGLWHKVNLMRTRLLTTLVVLSVALLLSVFLLPFAATKMGGAGGATTHWYHVWALQIFGAMGGALSAVLSHEPLRLHIAQYYLRQTVLYLRPAVGAAAGLALGMLQLSGVMTILPGGDGGDRWLIALLVAFFGGFSERLFLSRVDKLIGQQAEPAQSGKAPPGVPPLVPTTPKSDEAPAESKTKERKADVDTRKTAKPGPTNKPAGEAG